MWLETGVLGSHPPNTFFSMRSLASSYMDDGRYAEATGLQVMVLLYVWIVFGHRHSAHAHRQLSLGQHLL